MSGGAPTSNRRRRSGGGHGEASHERWLLTYADMITLLLAAILSIQAGDNPRLLREKLETYIAPESRGLPAGAAKSEPELATA